MNAIYRLQAVIKTHSVPCTVLGLEKQQKIRQAQVPTLQEVIIWLQAAGLHNCVGDGAITKLGNTGRGTSFHFGHVEFWVPLRHPRGW